MTARTPVYIDSGKLHVFEDGDTLPPWLSPSSMAWENLTGAPAGLTELAALTGPGYAKLDSAGAWSVQAAIPQADVSGLATTLAGLQPVSARLTAIAGLPDAAGWLHDDGAGNWAITTPTASQVGAESALGSPSTSGYLLAATARAFGRGWLRTAFPWPQQACWVASRSGRAYPSPRARCWSPTAPQRGRRARATTRGFPTRARPRRIP